SPLAIGDPIENPSRLYVTVEVAPSNYPDYFEFQQIPIVSRKFMNAISKLSLEGISFYPIRIHEKSGQIDGYFVFLVSKKIAAVNHERSTVTRLGKQIIRIKHLCLKPLSADIEIFRLQELAF